MNIGNIGREEIKMKYRILIESPRHKDWYKKGQYFSLIMTTLGRWLEKNTVVVSHHVEDAQMFSKLAEAQNTVEILKSINKRYNYIIEEVSL